MSSPLEKGLSLYFWKKIQHSGNPFKWKSRLYGGFKGGAGFAGFTMASVCLTFLVICQSLDQLLKMLFDESTNVFKGSVKPE